MKTDFDCIVIGGGPAGMMCALTAADRGLSVLLAEKNDTLGKKLSITGKGRCNLTNDCTRDEFFANIPTNPRFMYSSYSAFDKDSVMEMFESLGVKLKTERGNRVFPVSDRARDITSAMEHALADRNVDVLNAKVTDILTENGSVTGVTAGRTYTAPSVVIACGGCSYPKTGSDGDGYRFAKALGHTVVPPRPSLVPLVCAEKWCTDAMGLSLKNVRLDLLTDGKCVYSEQGEMLFTHFGVSGPLVLSASGHIRDIKKKHTLIIDLKPALDEKKLDERLIRDMKEYSNRDFINSLDKLLPRKLIPIVAKLSEIPFDKKVNAITREERHRLVSVMKELTLTVTAFRPIDEAIVTSGGVSIKEIDPKTMRSKLVNGLFFAGEVIDVDAYTGGFNLQIAFSTGHAAGENV